MPYSLSSFKHNGSFSNNPGLYPAVANLGALGVSLIAPLMPIGSSLCTFSLVLHNSRTLLMRYPVSNLLFYLSSASLSIPIILIQIKLIRNIDLMATNRRIIIKTGG